MKMMGKDNEQLATNGQVNETKTALARIELPPKLIPVFSGQARYRGAYGGRGSGKTRSFAKMAAVRGYQLSMRGEKGVIVVAREYINTLAQSSLAEVRSAILSEPFLARHYDIRGHTIRTKDGRIQFCTAGLRYNLDNIKSKARIHLLWIDEAENVTEEAWMKAIPSVREEGSEIWVTWNPERENSATHKRFREAPPDGAKIVALNWCDNPWFPPCLEIQRCEDARQRPEHYAHIWEGDFVQFVAGAYFSSPLLIAAQEGRIGKVTADPHLPLRAFWDLGGSGARSDNTAIWIAQFVGQEIRLLDYYEAQGQPLRAHVNWLHEQGYGDALCVLPHDGATYDRVHDVSFETALREMGFDVEIIANQGAGAARARIEAVRRLFPRMWFDEERTRGGVAALAAYHEKRDRHRSIGLGPEHDWSSHGADAFGLMAIAYEEPRRCQHKSKNGRYRAHPTQTTSWMAG